MAALGCPVAGDRKYGFRARPGESFRRLMLHSWRLVFRHPITGIRIECEAAPREPELRP
jgi:23S rRNA-/tRNA-specific pseudouridylate synthase